MLNSVLVFAFVIILGLGAGYFSTPIYNYIWPAEGKVKMTDIRTDGSKAKTAGVSQAERYISESRAINVVKNLPFVAESLGSVLTEFAVEQKPSEEYPVWLLEVKKTYPNQIPDIMYVQVDAASGNIMDLTKIDMQISGVGLSMTRQEVEKIQGKARKTRKFFDQTLGQTIRTDNYDGLEIIYNNKGLVIGITASESEFIGPKGVKTGDAKEQVIQLLGRGRTGPASLLTYFPLDDESQQLVLKLENNNVLEQSLKKAGAGN